SMLNLYCAWNNPEGVCHRRRAGIAALLLSMRLHRQAGSLCQNEFHVFPQLRQRVWIAACASLRLQLHRILPGPLVIVRPAQIPKDVTLETENTIAGYLLYKNAREE